MNSLADYNNIFLQMTGCSGLFISSFLLAKFIGSNEKVKNLILKNQKEDIINTNSINYKTPENIKNIESYENNYIIQNLNDSPIKSFLFENNSYTKDSIEETIKKIKKLTTKLEDFSFKISLNYELDIQSFLKTEEITYEYLIEKTMKQLSTHHHLILKHATELQLYLENIVSLPSHEFYLISVLSWLKYDSLEYVNSLSHFATVETSTNIKLINDTLKERYKNGLIFNTDLLETLNVLQKILENLNEYQNELNMLWQLQGPDLDERYYNVSLRYIANFDKIKNKENTFSTTLIELYKLRE